MKHGIGLAAAGEWGPQTLAEAAALAEEAGWDGIFLEDYITHWAGNDVPTYDPWISLAAMAMKTRRIILGIAVTPLSRRRPWKLARESVTLDHLSNGRLIVGIGIGGINDPNNFDKFGEVTDIRERAIMVDEALDILNGLWGGEPFTYQGKYYQVEEVTFLPKPVQTPRIPIWIGGGWPLMGPKQRAARWDGSCLYKHTYGGPWQDMTPDDVRTLKGFMESHRESSTPFDIVIGGRERSSDWEMEKAYIKDLEEAGATWWMEYVEPSELSSMKASIESGPLRID